MLYKCIYIYIYIDRFGGIIVDRGFDPMPGQINDY